MQKEEKEQIKTNIQKAIALIEKAERAMIPSAATQVEVSLALSDARTAIHYLKLSDKRF